MIYITDNFLGEKDFNDLRDYCNKYPFQIQKVGDKEFSILPTPQELIPLLQMDGHRLILTFIRSAHKEFDTDLRIHADNIIQGHKTSLASVLYISGDEVSTNGTAFYEHVRYGKKLPDDVSAEEFDRLITEDANDYQKWKKKDIVIGSQNRLLIYDSNYFHSKFPQVIDKGVRKVLVAFYSKI